MKTSKKIRVNYHLTVPQLATLRSISERTGLSVADLIRRAVDKYIAKLKDMPNAD